MQQNYREFLVGSFVYLDVSLFMFILLDKTEGIRESIVDLDPPMIRPIVQSGPSCAVSGFS